MVISGDMVLWLFFVFATSKVCLSIVERNAKKTTILAEESNYIAETQIWTNGSILGDEK